MLVLGRAFSNSVFCVSVALLAFAQASQAMNLPNCAAYALKSANGGISGSIPGNNNDQVLQWKTDTRNQFQGRAHVQGNVVRVYPDRNGHNHFSIQIGPRNTDTLEVVYNQDFGSVPTPSVGTPIEACGDYITSNGPSPGPGGVTYPASPDGAIIHWVHMATSRSGHNSGYLVVGGVLTGLNPGNWESFSGSEE